METGDKIAVQGYLSRFKQFGEISFDRVLSVPSEERIQSLISLPDGYLRVATALAAAIKSAMENINLKLPMSEDQIIELSGQIIDQSAEDNLSLEDVLLFLQQLVTGKSGKIYDRMDIPRFFELFEIYRQERHLKLMQIREEQHCQQKYMGDNTRISENDSEKENMREAMGNYLKDKYQQNQEQA
jgi:hypothetical protein